MSLKPPQCHLAVAARTAARTVVLVVMAGLYWAQAGLCREQSQINHPPGPPPGNPFTTAGGTALGFVPKFTPDFWSGQLANRVPAGAVLNGILENDLSSAHNKKGDIFHIALQDGFAVNGKLVVPPRTRILGYVVSATAAKTMRHGHPGRLQVSLKTLLLPDGRSVPFCGFIDHNVAHDAKDPPTKRHAGAHLADYGQQVSSFLGSFTSGIGVVLSRRHRGLDFELDKGEVLAVRLNRSLDLPPPAGGQTPTVTVPGLAVPAGAPGQSAVPGQAATEGTLVGTFAPVRAVTAPSVPGLVGADPDAPVVPATPAVSGPAKEDPNAIFNQPIQPRPLAEMPDPF